MKQVIKLSVLTLALLLLTLSTISATAPTLAPDLGDAADAIRRSVSVPGATIQETYGQIPLSFVVNAGQWDERVRFQVQGPGHALFFTPGEAVFALHAGAEHHYKTNDKLQSSKWGDSWKMENNHQTAVVRLRFVGADPTPKVEGVDSLPGTANFFSGNAPTRWRTHVPTFEGVRYRELYPGIDLYYHGRQGRLKSEFIVAPGADPERIRLRYAGMEQQEVDEAGRLVLTTAVGELIEEAPVAYQEVAGQQLPVSARYRVQKDGTIGFALGAYSRRRPLVIDPTLIYSTYLGGSGQELGWGLAVDSTGSAYITGWTQSTDFPAANSYQSTYGGGSYDTFVTKLNAAGNAVVYSTYLGGSGDDRSYDIVVDDAGSAYVTGGTKSTNFPTANPLQATSHGGWDVFITKLDATGSTLVYSTYLGGSSDDFGFGVTVDEMSNVYVTGQAVSGNFPVLNPFQSAKGGGLDDGFVTKLNATGSAVVYSTYLGGSSREFGQDIAVDGAGSAYVTGPVHSYNFPTKNPYQSSKGGGIDDGFVTKLNATGNDLVYSTYLGGNSGDGTAAIVVDDTGNAYVVGNTQSINLPTTPGAFDTSHHGGQDGFVTKFNAAGNALVYSTYLGGSGDEWGQAIALNSAGMAYVTGRTESNNFPTVNSLQDIYGGSFDGFVTKFNVAGNALVYSTYLGGSSGESARGIAVDGFGNAYVGGTTGSLDFPTANPYQESHRGGGIDAFVAKIGENQPPTVEAGGPYTGNEGSAIPLGEATASDADGDALTYAWSVDSSLCTFSDSAVLNPSITCDDNGSFTATLEVSDGVNAPVTDDVSITINNVPPTINSVTAPTAPVNINDQPVSVTVGFTDPGTADTHDIVWTWGDTFSDTQSGVTSPASQDHTYAEAGVYTVQVTVTDDDGGSDTAIYEFIVIYDPEGGFVTGGGWIMSPEGACKFDDCMYNTTGKANFGFVAKYKKGADVPTGRTEFQFKAGNLNFHSDRYDWLVVAGANAKYKGVGTINGQGEYGFMLTATDAELTPSTDVDLFRIKIWVKATEEVVYDNKMGASDDSYDGTELGGGNIVIHKGK